MSFLVIVIVSLGLVFGQHGAGMYRLASSFAPLGQVKAKPGQVVAMPKVTYVPEPAKTSTSTKPELTIQAQAGLIADPATGKVLIGKSVDKQLNPASLTKLMTTLVLLDRHKADEEVTITSAFSSTDPDAQKVGLKVGQKFKFDDLMQLMLVYSGNDVAEALAVYDAGSTKEFVARMNDYAKRLELSNTHFENPTGLDQTGHYSSAEDLLSLSRVLLHNPRFRQIVAKPNTTVSSQGGTVFSVASTNKLLVYPYITGLKTGKTVLAGECLITLSSKNGHEIITVVLNSPDRFQESKNMVEYAFASYVWQ